MAESKRLALFLDGTWNTDIDNTNVWRLRSLCYDHDEQKVYYSKGVGTDWWDYWTGGGFGLGLDDEVTRAYQWIVENYDDGDHLYIFGFSRGAYTARSLAGLISKFGMLERGAPLGLGQLWTRYRKNPNSSTIRHLKEIKDASALPIEDQWLREFSRAIPIKFIGVWDTVGSLGIPWTHAPIWGRGQYAFHDTDLHINQDFAYHAMALDEHRQPFLPTFWTKTVTKGQGTPPPRTLEQVEQRWFVGAHSNVGGGYSNDVLAQLPLNWLVKKASHHGLKFRALNVPSSMIETQINDSYRDMFPWCLRWLFRPVFRELGRAPVINGDQTETIINESIDKSVFERWSEDASYRPNNLTKWAERYSVDPAKMKTSVFANDPGTSIPD